MRVATGLSKVSGMFHCDRTDTIRSRVLKKEATPIKYPINTEMKELLEMATNYNPREHIVRYKSATAQS